MAAALPAIAVEVTRGNMVESRHRVIAVAGDYH